jgi:uncharacterized membrane protein (DUF2068 family)
MAKGTDKKNGGLRVVACIKGLKGLAVLLVGCGMLSLLHRDVQDMAEQLVDWLHLNPAHPFPQGFVNIAGSVTDKHLWWIAAGAALFSLIKFIEAFGLWRNRRWAQWFTALSGAIYIPLEIYELARGVNSIKLAALIINVAIVAYIARILWQPQRVKALSGEHQG